MNDCYSLLSESEFIKSLIIEEGVTNIGNYSFNDCYGIEKIVIPDSVKSIGKGAFTGCSYAGKVIFEGVNKIDMDFYDSFGGSYYGPEIWCKKDSYMHQYAEKEGLKYHLIDGDLPTAVKGDVNGDGKVNSSDALLVLQHTVQQITLTPSQQTVADVNKDSKVNSNDALKILQYTVGQISKF